MQFLIPYIGYSHDTSQIVIYWQDHFSNIIHVWIQPLFLLHALYDTLH